MFGISENPNDVCLQDRVVYTCTLPNAVLRWSVGGTQIGTYLDGDAVGTPLMNGALPGVEANLTDVNGTLFTSTLTISSAGDVANGSIILCQGSVGDTNNTVLRHRGEISGW